MRSRSESEDAPRADAPSPPEAPSRAEQMSGVGAEAPVEDREATDYSCSVCGRRFEGTADDLQQAGWSLQDGVVTCADCRAAGWQAS